MVRRSAQNLAGMTFKVMSGRPLLAVSGRSPFPQTRGSGGRYRKEQTFACRVRTCRWSLTAHEMHDSFGNRIRFIQRTHPLGFGVEFRLLLSGQFLIEVITTGHTAHRGLSVN